MPPGKRKAHFRRRELYKLLEKAGRLKAKLEHPFRVIKQQFGYAKLRYRGLQKNLARHMMLFALVNVDGQEASHAIAVIRALETCGSGATGA